MIIIFILCNYLFGWFIAYGLLDTFKESSNNYQFKNFTFEEKLYIKTACITGLVGLVCAFSFYFVHFIIISIINLFKEVFYK